MELKLLINQTDMIFHRFNGIVTDHGDYISVETPDNPGYFWGNYLIFSNPPQEGDIPRWRKIFRDRFANNLAVQHETYTWEGEGSASLTKFADLGFRLEKHVVMTAQEIHRPRKWNDKIIFRPFENSNDWEQALEIQVQTHKDEFNEEHFRKYRRAKNERYQQMISQGMGQWFGAFLGENLVGDMGLFKTGLWGRYQLVSTHPDYRRQGICSTLLYNVSHYGLTQMGIQTLVVAADETYFAKDIYASVGLKVTEKALGVERRPQASAGS